MNRLSFASFLSILFTIFSVIGLLPHQARGAWCYECSGSVCGKESYKAYALTIDCNGLCDHYNVEGIIVRTCSGRKTVLQSDCIMRKFPKGCYTPSVENDQLIESCIYKRRGPPTQALNKTESKPGTGGGDRDKLIEIVKERKRKIKEIMQNGKTEIKPEGIYYCSCSSDYCNGEPELPEEEKKIERKTVLDEKNYATTIVISSSLSLMISVIGLFARNLVCTSL